MSIPTEWSSQKSILGWIRTHLGKSNTDLYNNWSTLAFSLRAILLLRCAHSVMGESSDSSANRWGSNPSFSTQSPVTPDFPLDFSVVKFQHLSHRDRDNYLSHWGFFVGIKYVDICTWHMANAI